MVTKQPVGGIFGKGATVRLYLQAASPDAGYLTYQWYKSASPTDQGTPIQGQTSSVCTFTSDSTEGTVYVHAVVTNNLEKTTAQTESKRAAITVNKQQVHNGTTGVNINTRPLWLSLQNGNFEDLTGAAGADALYYKNVPGWNTTNISGGPYPTTNPVIQPGTKMIELNKWGTYTNNQSKNNNGDRVAELASDAPSSLYQEIATVPGKVYEWKLDHAGRKGSSVAKDVMAVIIGPAITDKESIDKGYNQDPSNIADAKNITVYPYGHNVYDATNSDKRVDKSYFADIIKALAAEQGGMPNSGEYAFEYNGHTYYIYIASDAAGTWGYHSGTYTVPEGQGTTVFAFANAVSSAPGLGNILDNISFSTGGSIDATSSVSYGGDGVLTVKAAKTGFVYGIMEERGSTVSPVSAVTVTDSGGNALGVRTDLGPGTSDWYTPKKEGNLVFSGLTPGKTYRVVGIPEKAINTTMKVNLTPSLVLDADYYKSFTIKAVSNGGSDDSGGNIQATAQTTPDGKAKIIVSPARADVEYALLATTSNGQAVESPIQVVQKWTAPAAGTSVLSFEGLERSNTYAIVARAKGYTEVEYASQVDAGAYVLVKTPSQNFKDVSPTDGSVKRSANGTSITVANNGSNDQRYLVYNAATGDGTAQGWQTVQTGKSFVFNQGIDASADYRVVAAEPGCAPSPGILSRGLAAALSVDYADEQAGTNGGTGVVDTDTEYRLQASDGHWIVGNADSWAAGTGGQAVSLSDALAAMAADQCPKATLTYRKAVADPDATMAVESTLDFNARASYDGSDCSIDYVGEKLSTAANSAGVEVSVPGTSSSTAINAGASVDLATFGYNGAEKKLSVRKQATDSAFASLPTDLVVPARPAAPPAGANGVTLAVDVQSKATITNSTQAVVEFRAQGAAAPVSWTKIAKGAISDPVALPSAKAFEVRYAAVANTSFASRQLTVSASNASLDVAVSDVTDLTYGEDWSKAKATVTVKNSGTKDANITNVVATGDIELVQGSTTGSLSAGATDSTTWTLSPKAGLDAGTYQASLTFTYREKGGTDTSEYTATYEFSFNVLKADQAFPTGAAATVEVTDTTAALAVTGADTGSVFECSADGRTWTSGTALSGLKPASSYTFYARLVGDMNHNPSPSLDVPAWTAYAAPDPSVLQIDFVGETVSYDADYEAATAAAGGNPVASGDSVSALAGASVFVRHRAATAGTIPASAWTKVALPVRGAAPAASATYATDSATADGALSVGAAFEYRLASGAASWIPVSSGAIGSLRSGSYEVRTPASSSAFASASASVTVGVQKASATFDLAGGTVNGSSTAPVKQTVQVAQADGTPVTGARFTNPGDAAKKGCAFLGWFAEGADAAWDFAGTPPTTDVAFTAGYQEKRHTATYHANGGAFADGADTATEEVLYEFALTKPDPAPTRPGYAFAGWWKSSDNGATLTSEWDFAADTMPDADQGLWAKWTPVLKASLPVAAKGTVRGDGTVDMPAASAYRLKNSSPLPLKVDSVKLDFAQAAPASDPLFASGREKASFTVNGLEVAAGKAGSAQTPPPGDSFKAPAATWDAAGACVPGELGLATAMALNGATVRADAAGAAPFAALSFVVDMEAGA